MSPVSLPGRTLRVELLDRACGIYIKGGSGIVSLASGLDFNLSGSLLQSADALGILERNINIGFGLRG